MKYAEKLPRKGSGAPPATAGAKRWLKKLVRRMRRRAEDRCMGDTPQRFTRGWYW
jgi:hypothetical protein